ncbi:MAG TPA: hypothetical protein VGL02_30600 [Streptomyces sp.]
MPEAIHPMDAPTVQHPLPVPQPAPEHLPGQTPAPGAETGAAPHPQVWTPSFHNSNVLNVDGTSSAHYPDGTQDVRAPDGSCWRLAPNGAVVHAWQEPPAPQWRPPESVAAGQPDGGTVVYHPDGSKELWHGGAPVARFDPTGRPAV